MTLDFGTDISSPAACVLKPVNLHNHGELELLRAQRQECGWDYDTARLDIWRSAADAGTKCLFWITIPSSATDQSIVTAGHISLDSISSSEDYGLELARPDKSLLTVSTFFVRPECRAKGIGREAMAQVERLARSEPFGSPSCTAITIMSLSCKYVEDDLWRSCYVRWTGEEPLSYERWYAKLGYVKWKEEACTKGISKDGEQFVLVEAFMRKILDVGR